ncbi:hypothetical protein A3K24_01620 [candidate division Kazan bacterium RIFCSPHIGHO2_01_FULL_44_14]|uniref:Uncharacterized protein n=1 Tax=candidate division Kazan bacterium RIFCSPLOWO2_01_FULL_45_19 TaxID=1798538 RepID=A0A1F4NQ02_UNCK3|nr:hypothetical protein [uncultured bacterium]OGB73535.1 MAG: hypothetical protein A3K51_01620 [candidate division Kazan bacterium RIFCSPLOWO2_01_FULL_45_19]OGB77780.1 MAG: hypothetical protein A3K24_01620 [candidate division Kazan bacterium RIFCSPHIGHO2_01_FULL_44_14]
MTTMIIIYAVLLLFGAGYAAINIFHIFRFRLPNDNAYLAMSVYLLVALGVIIGSISAAIIASQL